MTTALKGLLDGDIIVYRCGFVVKDDEPVEHAYQAVKTTFEGKLLNFPQADTSSKPALYISGKDNFREKVATILPYKGNRDPLHKPKYYKEIREYLKDAYGAQVVDGQEADDEIGIAQWKAGKETCIVSIDKDLDMIPGYHYNWVRDHFYYVSLDEANYNFYHQLLVGDRTDNIPGIDGIGPVKASRALGDVGKDLEYYARVVREEYKRQYESKWEDALQEVAQLIWIRREPGKGTDLPLLK